MDINKRNFIKWLIFIWVSWKVNSAFAQKDVEEVKTEVLDLINLENKKKLEKSILSIWEREVLFFMNFFDIKDDDKKIDTFVSKVEVLQKEFNFSQKSIDGVLWSLTLRDIYLKYYQKNLDKLWIEQKKRLDIYNEMLWYNKKSWALYKKLDPFNYMTYYWKWSLLNELWTFISKDLIWKIPQNIKENKNIIIVSSLEWKKILSFYVDWILYLASYVSPWTLNHKTQKVNTNWIRNPDLYHTSSEYPESSKSKTWKKWWAIMPYAVHVDGGVWIHWSDWIIDWSPHSHWCIRVPLFYVKEIFEKVKELWIKEVSIDTRNIY